MHKIKDMKLFLKEQEIFEFENIILIKKIFCQINFYIY